MAFNLKFIRLRLSSIHYPEVILWSSKYMRLLTQNAFKTKVDF